MRRYWMHIGLISATLTILVFYFFYIHRQWTASEVMNRAQIARMLALMRYEGDECESIEKSLDQATLPVDVGSNEWYGKYVSTVLEEGWMNLKEDGLFHPMDTFTYEDLIYILKQFHISESLLSFSLKHRQSDGMVPRNQWCEVYRLITTDSQRVACHRIKIHGSPSNVVNLKAWQVLTNKGLKLAEGLAIDRYMDQEIEIYEAEGEILCVIGVVSKNCKIENVWIQTSSLNTLNVFYNGYERQIILNETLEQILESNMGDLHFENGRLTSVTYKPSRVKASLIQIGDHSMVLSEYGEVPIKENLSIYQIYPSPRIISKEELATDGTVYEFVLEGNEICGIIYQAYTEETIRILLHESENDYEHSSVSLTSEDSFVVISGNEVRRYDSGTELTFTVEDGMLGDKEVCVKTENENGKITILSINRSCGTPSYHGEICLQDNGNGILIINQVNLEDYVAGVIPGEMPISYGVEALKAQAVCARTFARRALGEIFRDYPANLDDTVASQVYNNQEECEESIQATTATRGQVLQNSNGLTPTYFFSTSCGRTSDPNDVWYNGEQNLDENVETVFLSDDSVRLELANEDDFRKFINLEDNYSYFEEDLQWFRWQVFIKAEDIEKAVIKANGVDIGSIENIYVLERAQSGVLKSIQIVGSEDQCTIYGEYRIRQALSPVNSEIIPQNGESVTGWNMLPSGYIYFDPVIEGEKCQGYVIHGGGYGHGCGMSQNGAMKMAEMGKKYDEILKYFFPDSELIAE